MVLVVFMSGSILMLTDNEQIILPDSPSPSVLTSSGWLGCAPSIQPLRPACSRSTTFLWLVLVLAALCLRPDLAGVTSLVRSLGLSDASYYCLLHFFHSPALNLERLTQLWRPAIVPRSRDHRIR